MSSTFRHRMAPFTDHVAHQVRRFREILPASSSDETEKINFVRFGTSAGGVASGSASPDCADAPRIPSWEANGSTVARDPSNSKQVEAGQEYLLDGSAGGRQDGLSDLDFAQGLNGGDKLEDDDEDKEDKITEWQAGWNVTNAIQGMFIVSFPYAVMHGGYWALIAMTTVAYICCYTGIVLVDCLYDPADDVLGGRVRVRHTYVEVAELVWGSSLGGRLVNLAQLIELMMTCILYLVLCGDLLLGSFPEAGLEHSDWVIMSTVALLPCAFLRSYRHVSVLSFWNNVTHIIINTIVVLYCLSLFNQWQPQKVQFKIDIWTFPISMGIIVFSYTSQIFLPSLEGSLADRSRFRAMLYWTHIAAAAFKVGFGYIGYVTFGDNTDEVISNNLSNRYLRTVVNMALLAKCLLSYPLPYYATCKLLEVSLFIKKLKLRFPNLFTVTVGNFKVWMLLLRVTLIIFTLVLAIIIPHFAILMGLIGSFTGTMLSLVWPAYFHLRIKGHSLSWYIKVFDVVIIIMGLFCGVVGIYYSGHALYQVMHGKQINPFHKSMPILQSPPNNITML